MSGRISLVCLLVLCAACLDAQMLPGIEQFEIENVRLILLDSDGNRRGVLTGEVARRTRDGRVSVTAARLTFERKRDAVVLTAPAFLYTPDSGKFECAEGVTVALPDGGELVLPRGSGELSFGNTITLSMTSEGEGTLRSGPAARTAIAATVINPSMTAVITSVEGGEALRVDRVSISGNRGGELQLRLARLPGLGSEPEAREALVAVSCFGDVNLVIRDNGSLAELDMTRRARLGFTDETRSLEVTSNRLSIGGRMHETDDGSTRLSELAMDAWQNVRLVGDDFSGTGGELRYREQTDRREARLSVDVFLTRVQGASPDGEPVNIELRAKGYVDLSLPNTGHDAIPQAISTELHDAARVRQTSGTRVQWLISGRLVRLFSSSGPDGRYNHAFDGYSEGFTPLLRMYGPVGERTTEGSLDLQRAAVSGSRAEGTLVDDFVEVRVYGPEVLAVVYSNAPLAGLMRRALGLAAEADHAPLRDGRLVVRAEGWLDLAAGGDSARIASSTDVRLDHEPLPRNDAGLVTLTGDVVKLEIAEQRLVYALLERQADQPALATLGYDLLQARRIEIVDGRGRMETAMDGPGRIVARDPASVDYFRRGLDRLPKREIERGAQPRPDAAWLSFSGRVTAQAFALERSLEVEGPEFRLLFGEFERPRAGRSALHDLAELDGSEVLQLYGALGRYAWTASVRSGVDGPAVNLLRLEGDARVDSRLDRISARAKEAIEMSGSDDQRAEDSPISIILLRDAELVVEDAGLFFGTYVQGGVFGYDGRWTLSSRERLEVTLRPIDQPEGAVSTAAARAALRRALDATRVPPDRHAAAGAAVRELEQLAAMSRSGEALQISQALDEARDARAAFALAVRAGMHGLGGTQETASAARSAARARALLSSMVDVTGRGGLSATFRATEESTPPLDISMERALLSFDGLGQLVDAQGTGPVEVSRGAYTIRGQTLSRAPDGTLRLDDAAIELPEDTGVAVSGVRAVALKQREDNVFGDLGRRRTMVTRVEGRELRVTVRLKREEAP